MNPHRFSFHDMIDLVEALDEEVRREVYDGRHKYRAPADIKAELVEKLKLMTGYYHNMVAVPTDPTVPQLRSVFKHSSRPFTAQEIAEQDKYLTDIYKTMIQEWTKYE